MCSLQPLSWKNTYPVRFAIYNLILDSGIRVVEAVKLVRDLKEVPLEKAGGFYVARLNICEKSNWRISPCLQNIL